MVFSAQGLPTCNCPCSTYMLISIGRTEVNPVFLSFPSKLCPYAPPKSPQGVIGTPWCTHHCFALSSFVIMIITLALYSRESRVGDLVCSQYHDPALGTVRNEILNCRHPKSGSLTLHQVICYLQMSWQQATSGSLNKSGPYWDEGKPFLWGLWPGTEPRQPQSGQVSPALLDFYHCQPSSPWLWGHFYSLKSESKQNTMKQWTFVSYLTLFSLLPPTDQATGSPETEIRFYFFFLPALHIRSCISQIFQNSLKFVASTGLPAWWVHVHTGLQAMYVTIWWSIYLECLICVLINS